jgi:hypothetical protein
LLCPFVSDKEKSLITFSASVNIVKLSIFVIDAQLITLIKKFYGTGTLAKHPNVRVCKPTEQ